jgi:hypothetical protein
MFQQYRSRLFSLSAEFRNANSADHALRLAGDLCAVLADLVGDISTAGDRLASIERTIAQLDQPQPERQPEPEYVSILDPSFGVASQPDDVVYFQFDGEWQSAILLCLVPSTDLAVVRVGDPTRDELIKVSQLFTREYPIAYPNN